MVKSEIKKGIRVVITTVTARPRLLVAAPYLAARKEKATGLVTGPVPEHDGAWWVQHKHGIAAYWFHEFEQAPDQDAPGGEGKPYPDEP